MTKAIVCGGRDFEDYEGLSGVLDKIVKLYQVTAIVQGGARGADMLARRWALENGFPLEQYDEECSTYGKSAGPIRNQQMLEESGATVVIAFPGGNGTYDMIKRARRAEGVELIHITE